MKLKLFITIVCISFLAACGGTTYSGVMKKQFGGETTEGKSTVTLKKESEKVVVVTISNSDSSNPTFLNKCSSLKFLKQESAGSEVWMSLEQPCTLFKENDSKFTGMLNFDDQKLRLSGNLTENGSRAYFHEFEGTAK